MEVQQLSDYDIAQMAVKVEERGVHFYSAVAKKMDNPEAKQMFEKLAEEEREHRKIFLQLAEDVKPEGQVLGNKATQYVKALMGTTVFPDEAQFEQELGKITEPRQALALGIQAEKDAILLYHELYQNTNSEAAKRILNELLEAEKMHLVDLRNQLEDR